MYDLRPFEVMPILGDALQDAGCEAEGILNHCRGSGPHVRGCHVVDWVLDYAAGELLDLKNGTWLGEDEKEFTPARFKARMALQSVAVSAGGRFEFTFEDGNLFWGHCIQVRGTLKAGPTDAGIAG